MVMICNKKKICNLILILIHILTEQRLFFLVKGFIRSSKVTPPCSETHIHLTVQQIKLLVPKGEVITQFLMII